MTKATCLRCGGELPTPVGGAGEKVVVVCQQCGSQLQVRVPSRVGAETVSQPRFVAGELTAEQETADVAAVAAVAEVADAAEVEEVEEEDPRETTLAVGARAPNLDLGTGSTRARRTAIAVEGSLILAGAIAGENRLRLTEAHTVVGRGGADIIIDDPALSRRHFEVETRGNEFFIRDLDSSNGTFVNGDQIRETPLSAGDKIQVGETTLTFTTREYVPLD